MRQSGRKDPSRDRSSVASRSRRRKGDLERSRPAQQMHQLGSQLAMLSQVNMQLTQFDSTSQVQHHVGQENSTQRVDPPCPGPPAIALSSLFSFLTASLFKISF